VSQLQAGARLGPFEIVSLLGAGGMGEVYRARDPRLGREVAVKVLPRAWALDAERRQRFEAEARAAGAINHPNIVTLHDVGFADGAPYLVTEILEGETLRAVIERGALPPERAAEIVTQVANGLAAAHAKGIVHRDLKPENLHLLPDGRVKVLDFGIAKLTRTETNETAETTPVFASMTATGTIMGTVSYMSPEQLRDRPVDHRADLFALGAILYELLTGAQAFTGETAADRVSAILTADPAPLAPEIERAMPGIGPVVGRLLAKRPESRFDSARDLAFTLELLAKRPGTADSTARGGVSGGTVRFRPLTFRDGMIATARFAPDGQTVVYQALFDGKPSEIFLSRVETPEARGLGLREADLQSVSRTAEIAVTLRPRDMGGFVRLGTLARLPLIGGKPRELAEDVFMADWSPGGRDLAAIRRVGAVYQLEAPLGHVLHSTTGWMSHPRYSPDGSRIAFFDHPIQGSNSGHVCVLRPGEPPRTLTARDTPTLWNLAWRPDGEEIWYGATGSEEGDGVFGVALDGRIRQVYPSPGFTGVVDLNADGDALFITVRPRMQMETSTRAEGAREARDLTWLDWSLVRDVSPDGTMVLFDESGLGAGSAAGVFLRTLDGEPAVRLCDGLCSSFSRDGKFILAVRVDREGIEIVPTGVGKTRSLSTGNLRAAYGDWLHGSNALVLGGLEPGQARRLYRMDLDSGSIQPLHDTVLAGYSLSVSPDGRFVLARQEDGLLALFPTDGTPPRPFPELGSQHRPAGWAGDSRSFLVFLASAVPTPVFRVDAATGSMEPWMEVEPRIRSGVDGVNNMRFTRDGERYVCSYTRTDSVLYHARGLT
jgi:tRNA A-37 threonylcarbamoyl transferase component Bud32/Tol biopolymer transport system component